MHLPTKIPTLLGLLLVVIIVGTIAVGSETYFKTTTAASGSIQPGNVEITNVSDTTFSVSWTTQLPATGALSAASPKTSAFVLFDDQDVGTSPITTPTKGQGKYLTHTVTYRAASPDTTYEITILSDGKKSLNGDKPYAIHTASTLTGESGNLEPTYGTILNADKTPVHGALVYVTLDGSQTVSVASKPSGTWLIPLNLIRTQDLTSYLPVTDRMTVNIIVRANGLETTAITDTLNDSPVPDMMMGKTYDFRKASAQAPGRELALRPTPPAGALGGAVLGTSAVKPANIVALTIPAQGAAIPTTLPLIQGTGIPGKNVSLVLGITSPVGASAVVGADGLWSYTPAKPLTPGAQSVTMTTKDLNNKPVAITHMFTVLKSGSQVLGDATPSATLTPTPTATLSAITPTAILSATPTSTLSAQTPPTSGDELPTIILLLLGIGLMAGGGIAFIK